MLDDVAVRICGFLIYMLAFNAVALIRSAHRAELWRRELLQHAIGLASSSLVYKMRFIFLFTHEVAYRKADRRIESYEYLPRQWES